MSSAPPSAIGLYLRACLTTLLSCLPATPALSADWRLSVVRETQFGTSLAFLDASSIRGGGGQVSFAAATYFSRSTARMNRVSARVTANCPTMTYRFDQLVSLFNQRSLRSWASLPAAAAIPRTNIFDEIGSACGKRDFGTHVDNPEAFAARYFAEHRRLSS
jgi:hypothetical protein